MKVNLTDSLLNNNVAGKVSKCSGIISTRDFVLILEKLGQAWHGGAKLVKEITREILPGTGTAPLFYGDLAPVIDNEKLQAWLKKNAKIAADIGFDKLFEAIKDGNKLVIGKRANNYHVPLSEDDGKISGVPIDPDTYTLFDIRKSFDWTAELLKGTKFEFQTAGMIYDRSKFFFTIDLPELREMNLPGHKWLLGVVGGTDRLTSPSWNLSNIRQVCDNTVRASLASGNTLFTQKLTKDFESNLNAKKADLESIVGFARVWNETLKAMEAKETNDTIAAQVFAGEFVTVQRKINEDYKIVRPKLNKETKATEDKASSRAMQVLAETLQAFRKGDGNNGKTRADILNGFTQVYTRGFKGANGESKKAPINQWRSSEFGTFATRKENFFNVCADDTKFEELRKVGELALAGN